MPGVEIEELGIEKDHLHLLMVIPPRLSVAKTVGYLKQQTAKALRKKFPWPKRVYRQKNVVWSVGYFVSTVGTDEEEIRRYVAWQGKKDSGQLRLKLAEAVKK